MLVLGIVSMTPSTFTIDLFLYDLYQGLGNSSEQVKQNRRHFWQRIYPQVTSEQLAQFQQREESSFSNYINLLGSEKIQPLNSPLNGYYYPVKLGDSYGLMIDCSGEKENDAWGQLPVTVRLEKTKNWIEEHRHGQPGFFGESWLVWTQLTDPNQSPEDVAQTFYRAVNIMPQPDWKRDLVGQGAWSGATVFELERPDYTRDGKNRCYHVLLLCFAANQSPEDVNAATEELYPNLMVLFHARNKVLWLYEQSWQLKHCLLHASEDIQKVVASISPSGLSTKPALLHTSPHDSQQFKALSADRHSPNYDLLRMQASLTEALSISEQYSRNLSYLQEEISAIEINRKNYKDQVEALQEPDQSADLEFLDHFGKFALETCLEQVRSDYQAFQVGLQPLANFISTVSGITEIEKAKNERFLNRTVAIASVGISVASLAASTFTEQAKTIIEVRNPTPSGQPIPVSNAIKSAGLAFGVSLAIGLLGACMTWLLLKAWNRR